MAEMLDFSEVNTLARDLRSSSGRVGAAAAAVLRKSALDIEADAKLFCPVDTGNLKNSISTTITGDGRFGTISAEIGPTADYGYWVEYGTTRKGPAAFMGPAFDRAGPGFQAAIALLGENIL